jgi:hypothetical protein
MQMDPQNWVGQNRLPMRHDPVVLGDIPAQVAQIMRVGVLSQKTAGPDGEADVARIAHAMDDAGARKQQRDQAEQTEIARHLVDDASGLWREGVQLLQIAFGFLIQTPCCTSHQALDRADAFHPTRQPGKAAGQRRALAGTEDRVVTGHDLLSKSGAGARHSDDEDRRGIVVGGARSFVQPRPVEKGDARFDETCMGVAIEWLNMGQKPVAFRPQVKSPIAQLLVGEEMCQVEMCGDAPFQPVAGGLQQRDRIFGHSHGGRLVLCRLSHRNPPPGQRQCQARRRRVSSIQFCASGHRIALLQCGSDAI